MLDLIAAIAPVVAPVLLIPLVGFFWAKRRIPFDQTSITQIAVLFSTPCLVFSTLWKVELPAEGLGAMAMAVVLCHLAFAMLGYAALKLSNLSLKVYLPSLIFPNTGNLGLPVCMFAFGEQGLALAMIYMAVSLVGQFTFGPAIAAAKFDVKSLIRLPFLHAVFLALIVNQMGWRVPDWINNGVSLAGAIAVPIMLMSLGVALGELKVRHFRRAFLLALLRVVGGGAIGWLVGWSVGLSDQAMIGVLIVQSFMPAAVFNYLFARLRNTEPDEVASLVVMSTILSFAVLPFGVALVM